MFFSLLHIAWCRAFQTVGPDPSVGCEINKIATAASHALIAAAAAAVEDLLQLQQSKYGQKQLQPNQKLG